MANPLIRKYSKRVNKPLPNKSAGILDDFAVRKVVATKEGSITRTPVDDIDIANKKYVDDQFPVTHASTTGQTTDDHHAQVHTIASHDTTATGSELNTLTDNSIANALHRHSELVASDGSPDPALTVGADGKAHLLTTNAILQLGNTLVTNTDALIGRAGGANYHITGTAEGDLAIRPEATKKLLFGTTTTVGGAGVARMTILANGKVGIGTNSPGSLLNLEKVGSADIILDNTADNTSARSNYLRFYNQGSQSAAIRGIRPTDGTNEDGQLAFLTSNVDEAMRILANGNVGIGTSSPGNKLDVVSTSTGTAFEDGVIKLRATSNYGGLKYIISHRQDDNSLVINEDGVDLDFRIEGDTDANLFRTDAVNNRVGIGTSSPGAKLDVRGNIKQQQITQTFAGSKVVTDGSATGVFEIALATGDLVGAEINYTIKVDNGTDLQCHTGGVGLVAVNKLGTVSSDCAENYIPATEIEVETAGTLTDAWTCTDGAGKVTLNVNANTSLSGATITVDYTIKAHTMNAITAL